MKKSTLVFIVLASFSLNSHANDLEDIQKIQITDEKLDERVTNLELKAVKDKINFGADFKVESAIANDKAKIDGEISTSHSGYVGTLLFRLNADAKINNKLSLFASGESVSFLNQSFFNTISSINNRENQIKGEVVTITKAYFDWHFYENWLTFTGGRLPTTQGPPSHLKDGFSREGTYPVTAFSIPLDGFALTAKLSTPFEMKNNLSFRFIYNPGGAASNLNPFKGVNAGNNSNSALVATNHNLFSAMLEFEQPQSTNGIWEKMLAIVQFGFYNIASPQAFDTHGILNASNGGAPADLYRVYFDKDKLLDIKILSPYFEFNKIFKSPFDLYATAAFSWSESYAKARFVKLTDVASGGAVPVGYDAAIGSFLHPGKASGTRFIMGSRYEFPKNYFLGAEYMKSTEKAVPTAFYGDSLLSPNYLNGHSYEVYALKNMYNGNFIVRLGYTFVDINADLSNGFFFRNTVETVHVANLSFNIKI